MADFGIGVAANVAANVASSPIGVLFVYVIGVIKAVKNCPLEATRLRAQLEKIRPGAEWLEGANLELSRRGLQGDPTGAVEWVRDLRGKLCEASKTLERYMQKIVGGPATLKKLVELNKKCEDRTNQLTLLRVGIATLLQCTNVMEANYNARPEPAVVNPTVFLSSRWCQDMAVVESRERTTLESVVLDAVWQENGSQEGAFYPPVPQFQQQQSQHLDHSGYDQSSYFNPNPSCH